MIKENCKLLTFILNKIEQFTSGEKMFLSWNYIYGHLTQYLSTTMKPITFLSALILSYFLSLARAKVQSGVWLRTHMVNR